MFSLKNKICEIDCIFLVFTTILIDAFLIINTSYDFFCEARIHVVSLLNDDKLIVSKLKQYDNQDIL